ncbi:MAG: 16S rRNA (cytosine(1402)-N(4))-methyltransferase RsmH [Armatimonadetes bacterium]|nr:16S rRNA (cytosine(1402)-N(4))-methyltransferase RsmH [Armatimonadota bacterium]
MQRFHVPVMVAEVLHYLDPQTGQTVVDGTVGGAGHAFEIASRIMPGGRLIGIDRDGEALAAASERLAGFSDSVTLVRGDFADAAAIAQNLDIKEINGLVLDVGASSHQLDSAERGFSFQHDAPLDMRMDRAQRLTAREVVNSYSEKHLAEIIRDYGEERWAKRIARFIVDRRARQAIETTGELVGVILAAMPSAARPKDIHPATRTFMALRVAVNRELDSLRSGLEAAVALMSPGGRLVVLSWHSLEDRIVKDTFLRFAGRCVCPPGLPVCACGTTRVLEVLTKRPVTASPDEVAANPRARSAKLRAARKVQDLPGTESGRSV